MRRVRNLTNAPDEGGELRCTAARTAQRGNENAIMFQPPEPGRKLPLAGEYFIPQGKSGSREDVAPRKVISHAAQGPGSQPESLSFVLQGKGIIHALRSLEKRLHMQNGSERRPVSRLSADRAPEAITSSRELKTAGFSTESKGSFSINCLRAESTESSRGTLPSERTTSLLRMILPGGNIPERAPTL